jgi:hypothetical protein
MKSALFSGRSRRVPGGDRRCPISGEQKKIESDMPSRVAPELQRIGSCLRSEIVFSGIVALALAGCATTGGKSVESTDFKSRVITREEGKTRVSVAVLSAEESKAIYGVPLAEKDIQAVWIEVKNDEDRAYWLLATGLDPNFFPASEAAEAFPVDTSASSQELAQRFRRLAFHNPAPTGTTTTGFVLNHLDKGAKPVQVDLVTSGSVRTFFFMATVPGFRADYMAAGVFQREIYPAEQLVDYKDGDAFRAALESLPCCATNESGSKNADPLNLVVVGGVEDAFPAFVRRGWRPTEATWSGSVMKMIKSALSRDRYPYAPVSNLYLFGRHQDLALQKARDTIHQRNHLRLWLSPMRYQGKPVWVGQISRDIGSRLTIHSPTLTTHKIDPDVDEAVRALLEDIAYSQSLATFGFVKGVGAAPEDEPRRNLTTDPYYTSGLRAVLMFEKRPTPLTDIGLLDWERMTGFERETATAGERQ